MTTRKLVAWAIRLKDGSLLGEPGSVPDTWSVQRLARKWLVHSRAAALIGPREGRVIRVEIRWLA